MGHVYVALAVEYAHQILKMTDGEMDKNLNLNFNTQDIVSYKVAKAEEALEIELEDLEAEADKLGKEMGKTKDNKQKALDDYIKSEEKRLTDSIAGKVTDVDGNPIPGVTVTVTGENLPGARVDTTSSQGTYRMPELNPGLYNILAELMGMKTIDQQGIR